MAEYAKNGGGSNVQIPMSKTALLRRYMEDAISRHDIQESRKAGYNVHAMAQYETRLKEVMKDIENGAPIRDAIVAGFNGRLANALLKVAGQSAYTHEDATSGGLFYKPAAKKKSPMASTMYKVVSPKGIITHEGSKGAMLKKVKALNKQHGAGSHSLGNAPGKAVGEKFSSKKEDGSVALRFQK